MILKKAYPLCTDKKHDCFACVVRYQASQMEPVCTCRILTEGIPNCPFYKTIDEFKRGVRHGQENRGTDANDN